MQEGIGVVLPKLTDEQKLAPITVHRCLTGTADSESGSNEDDWNRQNQAPASKLGVVCSGRNGRHANHYHQVSNLLVVHVGSSPHYYYNTKVRMGIFWRDGGPLRAFLLPILGVLSAKQRR